MTKSERYCKCGCGQKVSGKLYGKKYVGRLIMYKRGHKKKFKDISPRSCLCGCGCTVKGINYSLGPWHGKPKLYIRGHNQRGNLKFPLFERKCLCDCKQTFTTQSNKNKIFISGHNTKVHNPFAGKTHTLETKKIISQKGKGRRFTLSPLTKEKMRIARIAYLKSGKGYNFKITSPERVFDKFIDTNNLPFKYVGDGKFWINKTNPDFIHKGGKKIAVEILGCYWHNCKKCFPSGGYVRNKERDLRRDIRQKDSGWDIYKIWEHQMDDFN